VVGEAIIARTNGCGVECSSAPDFVSSSAAEPGFQPLIDHLQERQVREQLT
jgi:hypothetical protein